jgi:hypothetical protein
VSLVDLLDGRAAQSRLVLNCAKDRIGEEEVGGHARAARR